MANLFVDFTGGNDSNNGSSFANRVKTITSGITAARTVGGDVIRIMKSEDPVSLGINATFTNLSDTVTLASALTTNIYASGAWTASANVTCTTSTTRKEGATSTSNAIASGFTTGLAAYYATGTLDLSAYNKVSLWIRPSAGVASGVLSISLCTDTAGATPVHTFTINQALASSQWTCLTFDNGSALNSAIQSIALNCISDPGTVTVLIDNVIACNALTLTSVIGLSSSSTSCDFYPIKSINGTTIKLDIGAPADASATARGWYGTTTTATCYKIEPIRPSNLYNTVQEAGTSALSRSIYSGGWNTTDMSTQTGLTFIDTGDSGGVALTCGQSFLDFENIVTVRGTSGFSMSAVAHQKYTNCAAIGASTSGFNFASSSQFVAFQSCTANNNATHGFSLAGQMSSLYECTANNNAQNGINVGLQACTIRGAVTCNNGGAGVFVTAADCNIYGLTTRNNVTYGLTGSLTAGSIIRAFNVGSSGQISGLSAQTGILIATNVTSTDTFPINPITATGIVIVNNVNGDANVSQMYHRNGSNITAQLEATTLHGTATKNWKHSPQNNHTADFPQIQKLDRIPVLAAGTLTFSVWVQRSSLTVDAMLVLRGGQCSGVTTDLQGIASAAINTWEQLTITCTPGQATALEFELHTWRNTSTSGDVFFSDFTCKQV